MQPPEAATAPDQPAAEPPAEPPPTIVVPVGSAAEVRQLAPLAAHLASRGRGRITFLSIRRLEWETAARPDFVPPWLRSSVSELDLADVQVRSEAILSQSVVGGIEAFVRALHAPTLLLHWDAEERSIPPAERSAFQQLFIHPPCDVLMLRGAYRRDSEPRVLLAWNGAPATSRAIDAAAVIAGLPAHMRVLVPIEPEATEERVTRERDRVRTRLQEHLTARSEIDILPARSYETAILETLEREDVSLLVVPAPLEGIISQLARPTLPRRLLRPAPTPVLVVNRAEARELTIFHALWGRIYDRIPNLAEADKVNAYMQLRRSARADVDYHVLMAMAAMVAALGLLTDSPAVVIGAMLIAPLMSPIAAGALGVVQGDARLIRISVTSVASGTMIAVAFALLVAIFIPGVGHTAEFTARTRPGFLDLLVALVSGAAAAYAISRPQVSAALPGVAVAAALVPPIAAIAVGIALHAWGDAAGAALLFLTNLIAIGAASALTFLWLGFRPNSDRIGRLRVFGRGAVGLLALLVLIAVPLATLSLRATQQDRLDSRVERLLETSVEAVDGATLVDVTVGDARSTPIEVQARLHLTTPLPSDAADQLRTDLQTGLGKPVTLELELINVVRATPP